MRTIIVDSDPDSLSRLEQCCAVGSRAGPAVCFRDPQQALARAGQERFQLAVLETTLPGMDGLELCRRLRVENPQLVPVFVTESRTRALEAFRLGAADYILKPFTDGQVEKALDRAIRLCQKPKKRVCIRTFGHFDVFVDGRPIHFSRQKSKEILAYLVDRWGGVATTQQILADLWEDRAGQSCAKAGFQTAFKTLRADLEQAGAAYILITDRNEKAIDVSAVECDYYRLMEGEKAALESFPGQYMADYSWAETTNANCIHRKKRYEEKQRQCE